MSWLLPLILLATHQAGQHYKGPRGTTRLALGHMTRHYRIISSIADQDASKEGKTRTRHGSREGDSA